MKRILLLAILAVLLPAHFCKATDPLDTTWTQFTGESSYFNDIAYGNDMFVAVGQGLGYPTTPAVSVTSPDGNSWTQHNLGTMTYVKGIAYGNGRFVCVGGIVGVSSFAVTSTNGVNWSASIPLSNQAYCVAYGNGRFVAGFQNESFVSFDGLNWTQGISIGTQINSFSITFANGLFVAVDESLNVFTSPDGLNWSQSSSAPSGSVTGVCYGNGLFVVGGFTCASHYGDFCYPAVFTSSDATNWTRHQMIQMSPSIWSLSGITYVSGEFMVGGSNGVLSSLDGVNWSGHDLGNGLQAWDVTDGNGVLVARSGGLILTSGDGPKKKPTISVEKQIYIDVAGDPIGGAYFDVTRSVSGTLPFRYQWLHDCEPVVDATNGGFSPVGFATPEVSESGDYSVMISNMFGSVTGLVARVVIYPPATPPIIVTEPTTKPLEAGSTATFNVLAGGDWPLNYQWLFNGQTIPDATNDTLTLNSVTAANAGGYSVIVTNAYGSATSAVAQLTVYTNLVFTQTNKPPPPPGNSTIPTDATHFKVFTNGVFVSGIGLDHNKSTIVLTHGWKESSATWPLDMANNIKFELGSSTPNIVAWDWTTNAAQPLPAATLETQGQGYALGENLTNALGANYSHRIHFIGHSLGTLVNARAANFIHTNGFAWANTQMTLFDDAEVAWGLVGDSWATLTSLLQNDSSPQQDWKHPLPDQCAWADNYITAVGMPHPQAVNVILTNLTPDVSNIQNLFDFGIGAWTGQFKTEITDYHNYSYIWYNNTVSQINNPNDPPYPMGFIRSWEGGGYYGRPAANTYYIESKNCPPSFPGYSGYDPAYNLVQITSDQANQYLNARPQNLISQVGVNLVSSTDNILANNSNQQIQLVNGPTVSASSQITGPAYAAATLIQLFTTSLISGNRLVRPMGGPVPMGGSAGNSPAYVWIPVTVPSNALTMAFNFMLQGNGNQDSFQVALNTNNLMTVETVLIQTNVTMSSGMIDVSQYAGQSAELFFGIVGGTSTNANLTVSDISFYITLPPSLQIQLAGTNVVLTWPLSGAGYVLQSANQLTPTISWATVTNVPVIVNFQYTVTNQISDAARFYRLSQ
jgi:pimeloyl-ACP methyl ester carboxylesterase